MSKPTTFYVAAHQQKLAIEAKRRIEEAGHLVNAQWITLEDIDTHKPKRDMEYYAQMDADDVVACDQLVLLTEPTEDRLFHKRRNSILSLTTGGKHVEFGIAMALNKPVHVVGEKENIFHYHPVTNMYEDLDAFINALEPVDEPEKADTTV
jgi:hypothetical protein